MQFHRRRSVPMHADYQRYRPILREDFRQFCAYCVRHEYEIGGDENYEIDHYRPQSLFRELVNRYANLYYCCRGCNRNKGERWPSRGLLARGYRFFDPIAEDAYKVHLREGRDGLLIARTKVGEYSLDCLRLNRGILQWLRRTRNQQRDRIVRELRKVKGFLDSLSRRRQQPSQATLAKLERLKTELRASPILSVTPNKL